jgi:hypothetical protein
MFAALRNGAQCNASSVHGKTRTEDVQRPLTTVDAHLDTAPWLARHID